MPRARTANLELFAPKLILENWSRRIITSGLLEVTLRGLPVVYSALSTKIGRCAPFFEASAALAQEDDRGTLRARHCSTAGCRVHGAIRATGFSSRCPGPVTTHDGVAYFTRPRTICRQLLGRAIFLCPTRFGPTQEAASHSRPPSLVSPRRRPQNVRIVESLS